MTLFFFSVPIPSTSTSIRSPGLSHFGGSKRTPAPVGVPGNAFVFVVLRIRPRIVEQHKKLGQAVFEACSKHLDPLYATMEIALLLEVLLLDPDLTYRRNNLHDRLRAAG